MGNSSWLFGSDADEPNELPNEPNDASVEPSGEPVDPPRRLRRRMPVFSHDPFSEPDAPLPRPWFYPLGDPYVWLLKDCKYD